MSESPNHAILKAIRSYCRVVFRLWPESEPRAEVPATLWLFLHLLEGPNFFRPFYTSFTRLLPKAYDHDGRAFRAWTVRQT